MSKFIDDIIEYGYHIWNGNKYLDTYRNDIFFITIDPSNEESGMLALVVNNKLIGTVNSVDEVKELEKRTYNLLANNAYVMWEDYCEILKSQYNSEFERLEGEDPF